jgi:hypothetical protein
MKRPVPSRGPAPRGRRGASRGHTAYKRPVPFVGTGAECYAGSGTEGRGAWNVREP